MVRRLFAVLLALALAAGLVAYGFNAPTMGRKMIAAAASDMSMSSKSDGCLGKSDSMSSTACSLFYCSMTSLPLVIAVLDSPPADLPCGSVASTLAGHSDPPDPHPPRPAILS